MLFKAVHARSEAPVIFAQFDQLIRSYLTRLGYPIDDSEKSLIKVVQSDRAQELMHGTLQRYCLDHDIDQDLSSAYFHE